MTIRVGAFGAAGIAAMLAATPTSAMADCRNDAVRVAGDFGTVTFEVEVADDNAERARGLMFVEEMGTFEGMLFVYDAPQRASFWMRNTLIPLDMLFVSPDGTVAKVHANAVPLDESSIFGGDDIRYVLEINGGIAARLGIEAGDMLQHPAIGPNPVMPCD